MLIIPQYQLFEAFQRPEEEERPEERRSELPGAAQEAKFMVLSYLKVYCFCLVKCL